MKAKVVATGDIVDVEFSHKANTREIYFYKDLKTNEMYNKNGLVFLDEGKPISEIDWEQRHFELVKAVLQALLSNSNLSLNDDTVAGTINLSVEIANKTITKLKER